MENDYKGSLSTFDYIPANKNTEVETSVAEQNKDKEQPKASVSDSNYKQVLELAIQLQDNFGIYPSGKSSQFTYGNSESREIESVMKGYKKSNDPRLVQISSLAKRFMALYKRIGFGLYDAVKNGTITQEEYSSIQAGLAISEVVISYNENIGRDKDEKFLVDVYKRIEQTCRAISTHSPVKDSHVKDNGKNSFDYFGNFLELKEDYKVMEQSFGDGDEKKDARLKYYINMDANGARVLLNKIQQETATVLYKFYNNVAMSNAFSSQERANARSICKKIQPSANIDTFYKKYSDIDGGNK